jgi:lipoprotein signal peptidase
MMNNLNLDAYREATKSSAKYFLIALAVIIIDQLSKILVHKFMYIHQEITLLGYDDDPVSYTHLTLPTSP